MLSQETAELAHARPPECGAALATRAAHFDAVQEGLAAHVAQTIIERASQTGDGDTAAARRFIDRLPPGYAEDPDLAEAVGHLGDALQLVDRLRAAKPAAYVSAAALARLGDAGLAGIGAALNRLPGSGLVPVYTGAPASPDLLRVARGFALAYLGEERDQPALCANAAHHQAVCGLFAAIEREERRGA